MTRHEQMEVEVADAIYAAIQSYSTGDERSLQAKRWQVGVSDIGYCSERTRRMLAQDNPEDTDYLTAFLGTAIGDHLEKAVKEYAYREALIQPPVLLTLRSPTHTYQIPGHPDIVLPSGLVLDGKTSRGLSLAERTGFTDRQKKFQRHGYALAAHDAGLFDVPLDEVKVGNVWIDRAGDDKRVLVRIEDYDPEVIAEMVEWLEEVIYAFTHDSEARKEPPREVCAATCGFFGTCRAFDTDVAGLITDEQILAAIAQYEEGKDLVRIGERLKDQAKPALSGMEGFALIEGERFALRHLHINETIVPESRRRAYDKIDLRKVK